MKTTHEDTMRREFEAWVSTQKDVHPHSGYYALNSNQNYVYYELRLMWSAWQAALQPRKGGEFTPWEVRDDGDASYGIYEGRKAVFWVDKEHKFAAENACTGHNDAMATLAQAPVGVTVECYPVATPDEAKQFLADTVDTTEGFTGKMYWLRDSEGKAIAITGCGPKGEQHAHVLARFPHLLSVEPVSESELVEALAKGYDEHRVYVQDADNVHQIRLADAARALLTHYRIVPLAHLAKYGEAAPKIVTVSSVGAADPSSWPDGDVE